MLRAGAYVPAGFRDRHVVFTMFCVLRDVIYRLDFNVNGLPVTVPESTVWHAEPENELLERNMLPRVSELLGFWESHFTSLGNHFGACASISVL